MKIDVVTLFPELYEGVLANSIVGRAARGDHLTIATHQLRDHAADRHRTVDDAAFGGEAGMVLKPEPLFKAVETLAGAGPAHVVLTAPAGAPLNQATAARLAAIDHLILVSGYYEGVDERFIQHGVHEQISIGDYVLTSGDLPVMVLINAVARLLPSVVGNPESVERDTFATTAAHPVKHPVYTRPETYRGWSVPSVLLSGDHRRIAEWRDQQAAQRSRRWREQRGEGGSVG